MNVQTILTHQTYEEIIGELWSLFAEEEFQFCLEPSTCGYKHCDESLISVCEITITL